MFGVLCTIYVAVMAFHRIRSLLPLSYAHWIHSMKCAVTGFLDTAKCELQKRVENHMDEGKRKLRNIEHVYVLVNNTS